MNVNIILVCEGKKRLINDYDCDYKVDWRIGKESKKVVNRYVEVVFSCSVDPDEYSMNVEKNFAHFFCSSSLLQFLCLCFIHFLNYHHFEKERWKGKRWKHLTMRWRRYWWTFAGKKWKNFLIFPIIQTCLSLVASQLIWKGNLVQVEMELMISGNSRKKRNCYLMIITWSETICW